MFVENTVPGDIVVDGFVVVVGVKDVVVKVVVVAGSKKILRYVR